MINRNSHLAKCSYFTLALCAFLVPVSVHAESAASGDPADAPTSTSDTDRPVIALGGELSPNGSSVDPLKGLIRTFEGDLAPHVGRIRTFEGEVDPKKGLIRTFEGDIDPHKGLIRTFWGNLTPVAGELDPKVGRIRTFTDSFLPGSISISTAWAQAEQSGDFAEVARLMDSLFGTSRQQWQESVTRQSGKNFDSALLDPFLKKWKVNLSTSSSLKGWSAFDRQAFLLDWYDNVLKYSEMDRTDHWMNAVRWTPALTQVQGGGSKAVIGLIDFFAANDSDVRSKVIYSGGYQNIDNAHGAAVGSLIVASHNNRGIMGIAPRATIAAYNPFDQTLSASWEDVRTGIAEVGSRGASVINLSLGVTGYTLPSEWRDVFSYSAIDSFKDNTIYVIAAGNDGVVQSSDIDLTGALDSTFLVVGSVDPYGRISSFSNTPGTACITISGECANNGAWDSTNTNFLTTDYLKQSGLLMNRFLVAPGELILVSDGAGGVTRMSGTSFAAPLVSGAIALIQDRWPWLKHYPREVAKIILESAQDLGAPGVDPIYGHGLLDITAAQSALNFDNLKYYLVGGSSINEVSVETLRTSGIDPIWSANDFYFSAFEKIDSAERDFLIPLSSRLFNGSVDGRAFQKHMHDLFMAWLSNSQGTGQFASLTNSPKMNVSLGATGWNYAMRGRFETVNTRHGFQSRLNSTVEVTTPENAFSFLVGQGDGALAITGNEALQFTSDYNPNTGGVDPLLGFASGGAHIAARASVAPGLSVAMGFTNEKRNTGSEFFSVTDANRQLGRVDLLPDYAANAANIRLDYRVRPGFNMAASYTRLVEGQAFFGVRSLDKQDFGKGTVSHSMSFSADILLTENLKAFASSTVSKSYADKNANFRFNAATGTAWQLGFAKNKLFGKHDHLRATLAQPLTLENGVVNFQTVGVVNRETGEKGIINQRFSIADADDRRYRVEGYYGASMLAGLGEVALFSTYELRDVRADIARWTIGAKTRISF